jgi:hydrogenase maturation protease
MTEPMTDSHATVVIGLGNPLMGDDGLGLAALAVLREEGGLAPDVELLDGGTWGMNLLPVLESADRVILLDAIQTDAPPGTVVELAGDQLPAGLQHKLSPHQIDLREVLALGALRGTLPGHLVAIGIVPARVELSTALTPVVSAALPAMLDLVRRRLAALVGEEPACTS